MYAPGPFAIPIGSFQQPVKPPTVDPFEGPLRYIPINCEWLPFIAGALQQLLLQATWDTGGNMDALLKVQGQATDLISKISCIQIPTLEQLCPPVAGGEQDFDVPLRIDCNCNVFVTCCDGTEKQILTADQVNAAILSQPGGGAPQPPSGGCQKWSGAMHNGAVYLVPTSVGTGDILTITHKDGATTNAAPFGRWNCPDGNQFAFGQCQNNIILDPTALAPSLPLGQVLFLIGATYYDGNTPLTVPGGISNQQVAVVLNYPSGSTIQGDVSLVVERCNNQVGSFLHHFPMLTSTGGFVALADGGTFATWSPGDGWIENLDTLGSCSGFPLNRALLWISRALPAATFINTIRIVGQTQTDNGAGVGARQLYIDGVGSSLGIDGNVGPFDITLSVNATVNTDFSILINSICVSLPAEIQITDVYVAGVGADPF